MSGSLYARALTMDPETGMTAEDWAPVRQGLTDYVQRKRQEAEDKGLYDPATGMTSAGWNQALQAFAGALVGGTGAPKGVGIRAFHGSPYDFERFDIGKIGTGEGNQSYGRGLYFAEREGTARSYRDALTQRPIDDLNSTLLEFQPYKGSGLAPTQENLRAVLAAHPNPTVQKAATDPDVMRNLGIMLGGHDVSSNTYSGDALNATRKLRDWFDAQPGSAGKMYEVALKADPEQMLHWDKPLSEQSPYVQERLAKLGIGVPKYTIQPAEGGYTVTLDGKPSRVFPTEDAARAAADATVQIQGKNPTGQEIYRTSMRKGFQVRDPDGNKWGPANIPTYEEALAQAGGDKTLVRSFHTSDPDFIAQRLREAGIPGIRYYDQGSRAAGEGSHNYVAFSDDMIDILRKYGIAGLGITGAGAAAAPQAQQEP